MKISTGEPRITDSGKFKVDKFFYDELKRIVELKPWHREAELIKFLGELSPIQQRTGQQNKALHKFFTLLAESLNLSGLEMKKVLQGEIWWTPHSVKENLWRPVQKAMTGIESTTELEKQVDIDKIHEQLMHRLSEKHEVEWIEFPHEKKEEKVVEKIEIDYPDSDVTPEDIDKAFDNYKSNV